MAPESDDNPGLQVQLEPAQRGAGRPGGAACFIRDGRYRFIPYHRLFTRVQHIEVPGCGAFDGYANRDSLKYRKVYGLEDIPTLIRGTLRRQGASVPPGTCSYNWAARTTATPWKYQRT